MEGGTHLNNAVYLNVHEEIERVPTEQLRYKSVLKPANRKSYAASFSE